MALQYIRTDSVKKAYQSLGTEYEAGTYAEISVLDGLPDEVRITNGIMFIAGDYSTGLAISTGTNILIQNGINEGIMCVFELLTTTDCTIEIFEAPTFSAAGSTITPVNLNRSSNKVLGATITKNPTITIDGTKLGPTILNPSGISRMLLKNPIILAPSTKYLIKVVNTLVTASNINILMQAYQPKL